MLLYRYTPLKVRLHDLHQIQTVYTEYPIFTRYIDSLQRIYTVYTEYRLSTLNRDSLNRI